MSHIPFGYKIEDGAAVICDEDAEKVKKLFKLSIRIVFIPSS